MGDGMKALFGSFSQNGTAALAQPPVSPGAAAAFNSRIAQDLHIAQATQDMLQAFYRREHDTVTLLAGQGAQFNAEMLQVAVQFRDHHLAKLCLDADITPSEDMVRSAVDRRDAPFAAMLMRHLDASDALKDYISRHGTESLRQSLDPRLQYAL